MIAMESAKYGSTLKREVLKFIKQRQTVKRHSTACKTVSRK